MPWFRLEFLEGKDEVGKSTLGEDTIFCRDARKRGYRVWCDTDLTKQIAHIGESFYKPEVPRSNRSCRSRCRRLLRRS